MIQRRTPAEWWDAESVRLRERRRLAGSTRKAVAAKIGVNERTLAAWEVGMSEPSVVDWLHWRQALGMSVAPNLAYENKAQGK